MKRKFALLCIVLVSILAATLLSPVAASAQTGEAVYVPFSFTVDHQVLPSGFYKVSLVSDRYIAFIDARTGRTQGIAMVRPETGNRIEPLGGLIFYSAGDSHILKEVRMAGSSMHSVLVVQPKGETIAANSAATAAFEIAMT